MEAEYPSLLVAGLVGVLSDINVLGAIAKHTVDEGSELASDDEDGTGATVASGLPPIRGAKSRV